MCLAAEIVLCLITWYCTRPCWGYTVILDFQTIITLLTSKIELNFETHLGLGILENGLWICTYPDVMPEIQRSLFTLFLNLHNIRSLSLLNVSIFFFLSFTNSSSTSATLAQGLINSWLGYHNYLLPDSLIDRVVMLRSILSRTPKVMISLKM